eukprot:353484-Chlamydomonas_euryale.AAC.4
MRLRAGAPPAQGGASGGIAGVTVGKGGAAALPPPPGRMPKLPARSACPIGPAECMDGGLWPGAGGAARPSACCGHAAVPGGRAHGAAVTKPPPPQLPPPGCGAPGASLLLPPPLRWPVGAAVAAEAHGAGVGCMSRAHAQRWWRCYEAGTEVSVIRGRRIGPRSTLIALPAARQPKTSRRQPWPPLSAHAAGCQNEEVRQGLAPRMRRGRRRVLALLSGAIAALCRAHYRGQQAWRAPLLQLARSGWPPDDRESRGAVLRSGREADESGEGRWAAKAWRPRSRARARCAYLQACACVTQVCLELWLLPSPMLRGDGDGVKIPHLLRRPRAVSARSARTPSMPDP